MPLSVIKPLSVLTDARFCLLQNLGYMTKSYIKYHIDWLNHFEATEHFVWGVSLGSEYCCLSLPQAVTSQAG